MKGQNLKIRFRAYSLPSNRCLTTPSATTFSGPSQTRDSCLSLVLFHPRGGCPRLKAPGVMGHTCPVFFLRLSPAAACAFGPAFCHPDGSGIALCSVEVGPRASSAPSRSSRWAASRPAVLVRGLRPQRRENSCLLANRHSSPSANSCRGRMNKRAEPALPPLQCFPAGRAARWRACGSSSCPRKTLIEIDHGAGDRLELSLAGALDDNLYRRVAHRGG